MSLPLPAASLPLPAPAPLLAKVRVARLDRQPALADHPDQVVELNGKAADDDAPTDDAIRSASCSTACSCLPSNCAAQVRMARKVFIWSGLAKQQSRLPILRLSLEISTVELLFCPMNGKSRACCSCVGHPFKCCRACTDLCSLKAKQASNISCTVKPSAQFHSCHKPAVQVSGAGTPRGRGTRDGGTHAPAHVPKRACSCCAFHHLKASAASIPKLSHSTSHQTKLQ